MVVDMKNDEPVIRPYVDWEDFRPATGQAALALEPAVKLYKFVHDILSPEAQTAFCFPLQSYYFSFLVILILSLMMGIILNFTMLTYLHEEIKPKVVHRDIKSSNILIDDDFNAKIFDFGLAKLLGVGKSHITTRVMGTLGFTYLGNLIMNCTLSIPDQSDNCLFGAKGYTLFLRSSAYFEPRYADTTLFTA
ncbi:Putative receptor-like protein kinase [Glycine soja]|uniref:non-specific serine/threonine protein kinase n=1 Tax=Glycine soja TaxID=3848 RepID=A0A0B2SGX4_GLYSO|nr:Putative receptor-like protein kinase [Glycine soja]